jgi:alkanesulfonate monooxygenase SsuD/methylene tetrahydromethanopterin reductase-like flavin-dependent oxidoreductase (luciferase family)
MSTLDHLSGGRVGWNIVTGYLDSAARNLGLDRQLGHDARYDLADEYLDVVYKLWEKSWDDDAVLPTRTAASTPIRPACTRSATRAALHGARHPPVRTLAAAHALPVPGRHLAARPGLRRAPCRSDLRQRAEQEGRQALRRPDPRGGARRRPRSATIAGVHPGADRHRAHRRPGAREAWRLPGPRRHRGRAGPAVRLDRRRLLKPAAGRHRRLHRHRCRPQRAGLAQQRRSRAQTWTVREAARFIGLGGRGPVLVGDPARSPTSWKPGSTRPASTASTWPSPWPTNRCATWSSWWCRSCSGAGATARTTKAAPCAPRR